MAEINNNIPNFGRKVENIEPKPAKQAKAPCECGAAHDKGTEYVPDPGVLGRSQVVGKKDISKSVDEAVSLARENYPLMCGCESVFNTLYQINIDSGMPESDAFMNALLGEEEFYKLGYCRGCN